MTESAYDRKRKQSCEWCAKGINRSRNPCGGGEMIHVMHVDYDPAGSTTEYEVCAAPTELQYIEELTAPDKCPVCGSEGCSNCRIDLALKDTATERQRLATLARLANEAPDHKVTISVDADGEWSLGFLRDTPGGQRAHVWYDAESLVAAIDIATKSATEIKP